MNRPFHIRPATRRRLTWLVALMLLWQQVAVASYACAVEPAVAGIAAVMAPSTSMAATDDGCLEMRGPHISPLCQQRCLPDHVTQVATATASVPFNALAAMPPMSMSVAVVATPSERVLAHPDHRRTLPSPALLFCSLLI